MTTSQAEQTAESAASLTFPVFGILNDFGMAYRDMANRNFTSFTDAIESLIAVKNPTDFIHIQQKFVKTSVETAADAGREIARLLSTNMTFAGPATPWMHPSAKGFPKV